MDEIYNYLTFIDWIEGLQIHSGKREHVIHVEKNNVITFWQL